jgi:hypothetical protein
MVVDYLARRPRTHSDLHSTYHIFHEWIASSQSNARGFDCLASPDVSFFDRSAHSRLDPFILVD